MRKITAVARKVPLKDANDESHDLIYWLNQPVQKRAEAVTFLVRQTLKKDERMDKTKVNKFFSKK